MKEKIKKSIEEVRPYLQADGGDISLVNVTDDYVVEVQLLGACGSCPFSVQTLKLGVEEKLKQDVPEVKEVVSV
ncbi:MAG: NifU family protein [Bacteroidales bacterium]